MNLCLKFTDLESEIPYLKSMLKKSSKASSQVLGLKNLYKLLQIIANWKMKLGLKLSYIDKEL